MELASMLAGERFSDHPRAVCPVIAGFLRSYNDRVPPHELPDLYPLAALVVGSRSTWRVRRLRLRRLRSWNLAAASTRSARLFARLDGRPEVVVTAARAAVTMDRERRERLVTGLVRELVAMGECRPASDQLPTDAGLLAAPERDPAIAP
jgi:hypothetical protein